MAAERKLEADVIICGCGFAGLAAGLTARDYGARVIIFEKRNTLGASSVFAEGTFGLDSSLAIANNVEVTEEEAFRTHMEYSHWIANAPLVRIFIARSVSNIEWLQQLGVEFEEVISIYPGCPQVWHIFKGESSHRGSSVVNILAARARESGIQIYTGTPVKGLIMEKTGFTAGIVVEDKDGNSIRAYARDVIIATSGFMNNREMLEKYTRYGYAIPSQNLGLTGDGIKIAWEVGAAPEGVNVLLARPAVQGIASLLVSPEERVVQPRSSIAPIASQPYLWVNQLGERFCAEDLRYHCFNALSNQPEGIMYVIFDEDTKKYLIEKGIPRGAGQILPVKTKLVNLEDDLEKGVKYGNTFMADTTNELQKKCGFNPHIFQATVDNYNRCCEQHHDNTFFKNPKYLLPIRKPKFYAVKCCTIITSTMGGIKVNNNMEVLNTKNQVIMGLYAAGNCAGGLYGDTYDIFNTTGGASAFAFCSGRIAGENAAKHALSK